MPRFHFPRSDGDYKGHVHNTKLMAFLEGIYRTPGATEIDPQSVILGRLFARLTNLDELVPTPTWPPPANHTGGTGLMTGDLCVIKAMIPGVWHLAAMQDDRTFMHCAFPAGVTEGDITQGNIRERLVAVFRCRSISAPDHDLNPDRN